MAIVIETCPECGHDLMDIMIATYPPIPRKECFHCGWYWEGEREKVNRVPFSVDTAIQQANLPLRYTPMPQSDKLYEISPCNTCNNNAANGGSGVCHCILGLPEVR